MEQQLNTQENKVERDYKNYKTTYQKKTIVKKAIAKTGHIFNIWDLKCSINKKVGELKAEVIKSKEPIKWDDLDKTQFKPIRQWQAWGKRKEYADSFDCAWFHFTGQVPK
ncbi:MAG: hypothetical protein K2I23_00750 [Clostridia bacterium]|nr:hypothetical protein [Clostridia bacterium]